MLKYFTALCLSLLVTGCATTGREFDRTAPGKIEPGVTTREEVIRLLGPTTDENIVTLKKDAQEKDLSSPVVVQRVNYYYYNRYDKDSDSDKLGQPNRHANINIANNTVVYYRTASSFKSDNSDFDPSVASRFKKGETTQTDVRAALGEPTGRGIYPYAASPMGTAWVYTARLWNVPAGSNTFKDLAIYFDQNGKMEDLTVSAETKVIQDETAAARPVFIPIYLPAKR